MDFLKGLMGNKAKPDVAPNNKRAAPAAPMMNRRRNYNVNRTPRRPTAATAAPAAPMKNRRRNYNVGAITNTRLNNKGNTTGNKQPNVGNVRGPLNFSNKTVATVGGRKRKTVKKHKVMTKQTRKVDGVTRVVRKTKTGRRYVLLHGRRRYL
jgi:hypothetical protein